MIDVRWAVTGGLDVGWFMGTLVGRAIIYLGVCHRGALGSDEFMALGLIALTYGLAPFSHTYGFLAVFAAGLALRRNDEIKPPAHSITPSAAEAPAHMMQSVHASTASSKNSLTSASCCL